jgi:FMN-dependent NADH-azoreductase
MKLLYVEASPRKGVSASIAGAAEFLTQLAERQPGLAVDKLDLWSTDLPEFDGAAIAAKYAKLAGRALSEAEERAWATIGSMVNRLRAADALLIATPMWNFGIPYKLKHWIDLITQPGLTFTFDPLRGYAPVLPPKPGLVILSSAGDYRNGPSFGRPDLATPYLKAALAFIGFSHTRFVPIGPAIGAPELTEARKDAAHLQLRDLAATFGKGGQ